MKKTILVTGATGNVGGAVVEALAAEGATVRAASREPGMLRRSENITPVRLDYHRPETVGPALGGADGLFLIALPLDPWAPEVLGPVIDRARRAGVRHIVLHSALGVERDETAPLRRVERYLQAAGVPWSILRSNFFMENFSRGFIARSINERDTISLPAGAGQTSFISTRDIASVAAHAFDEGPQGQEYNLTGIEALDHYQVAEMISEAAGRQIGYQALTEKDFLGVLRRGGLPDSAARYLAMLYRLVRNGQAAELSGDVLRLTRRAPMLFETFAAEHADAWRGSRGRAFSAAVIGPLRLGGGTASQLWGR